MASAAFVARVMAASFVVPFLRLRRGPLRPSWSTRFEIVARALKAHAAAISKLDWSAQRAAWDALNREAPIMKKVAREPCEHAGMRAEWFRPRAGITSTSVVLYLHGGSFIYGSIESHAETTGRIALATGAAVLAIDYRRAPEHPHPAGLQDALAAYRALPARSNVLIGGDSAGANLAITAARSLRDEPNPPAGLILLSPWVDLSARGGSLERNEPFDYAMPSDFEAWTRAYLGPDGDPRHPDASPLHADLDRLPPMLVVLGGAEMLHDQVTAFVARAREAGVRVELFEQPDMIHDFHAFASFFPVCEGPYERIGEFAKRVESAR